MYTIEKKKRINSRKFTPILELEDEGAVINYLKENNLVAVGTPYVFTHIELSNGMIIKQSFRGLICSPVKLAEMLNIKK